ncbi:nickel ABC transporter substrate-binding protein [Desulfosarcina ovata]|uniref:Nickel ABC transporter, nickel/metallophore periplasmic binding protein n=1 Tax=Desulfosarcina ovata subsp. ovata TaxID=2752305 RepID=A0A5K8AGJ9_9BACT|nr:nickel ABC transporter substrate-binding protein [Desulfosarcina ovata]BBO91815.1 nickel ABC transporter, nickel/metallophore periplasmic binding protein [Desulfosarcina ovata subsp. ovata]
MKRLLLIFLFVAGFGLLPGAAPVLAESDTLIYSWPGNVGPLNPHLYSPNQMFAQAMVYEPLVRYSLDGNIQPCLAESWDISPDGRVYTIRLRQGVVFSDGVPFDAKAVKMNIDAVMANAKRHAWLELVHQIRETVIVDAHTVKIILKDPYYPFLQDMALVRPFRFLSPSAFPDSGNTADGIKQAVGTGPWVLVESKLGEYDRFERNENYWGKRPPMKTILVKVIPDPNSRAVAFETGAIDLIYGDGQISLDTYDRFRSDPRYRTAISQPLCTRSLAINSGRGPTRELAVRQAIQHAVDKDAIVKGVFLDTEIKADTLYSANIPYCDLKLPPYAFDPAKAESILATAGWKRTEKTGFRTRDGQVLSVDLCFVGNDAVMKAVAEVLQSDLQRVGVKINLLGEEQDSFYKRQKSGEFGLIFNNTWGPPYEPHSYLSSWRVPSHADYEAQSGLPMKPEIDATIGRVLVSTDEGVRADTYRKILTTIHEQAVYLSLSYTTGLIVHGKGMQGASFGPTKNEIPFETMFKE